VMGTVIYETKDGEVEVKRFFGGEARGVCFQITTASGYVQLTGAQYEELLNVLDVRDAIWPNEEPHTEYGGEA
jgi:hypothetical protein